MPSPAFPPEILALVLPHDRPTLVACALAGRAFLPPTRAVLFASITLTQARAYTLSGLLASPLCTFAPYVRRLELGESPTPHRHLLSCRRTPSPSPSASPATASATTAVVQPDDLVHAILTKLPHVSALRVTSYASEPLPCHPAQLAACFPHLSSLELRGTRFSAFSDLVVCLSAFSALRSLALLGVSWKASDLLEVPTAPAPVLRQLHTLRLLLSNSSGSDAVLRWILDACHPDVPPIAHLCVEGVTSFEAHALHEFISAVGVTLQRLVIHFKREEDEAEDLVCSHPLIAEVPKLQIRRFAGMSLVRT